MFHKDNKKVVFNLQLVLFKIKSMLVNVNAKVIQKINDVIIEYCKVQVFGAKMDLPSKQTTKINKNHN